MNPTTDGGRSEKSSERDVGVQCHLTQPECLV